MSPQTAEESSRYRGRTQQNLALAGIMLPLLALNTVSGFAIAAVPQAITSLNGFDRYSWPATAFLLTSTITMPVFAKLSDLYGRKWFYLFGASMCLAYAVLAGSAGALPIPVDGMSQLIAGSALIGLGQASIMVLSFTLVADLFPPLERGRYQGILAAVSIVPFTFGPSLGGWVTDHFSWRLAYYVNVPLDLIAMVTILFTLPGFRPREASRPIDWAGILVLCGWLAPLLLALTWVGQTAWRAPLNLALLIASAILLVVFLLVELRVKEPLLNLGLFRERRIALVCLNLFLMGGAVYGASVYLPLFLQGGLGASATTTGAMFALYVLATMAGSLLGGRLLSRTGSQHYAAIAGAGLAAVGLFLFSRMAGGTTQPEVLRNVILCGIGLGVLTPTYEVLVQNAAPAGTMGVATGITQFSRAVGGSVALAIFGTMLLRIYHGHMDNLIPLGASAELRLAFDDPLKLTLAKPNLNGAAAGVANVGSVLISLLNGARASLISALQSIFVATSAALAVSCLVNLFIARSTLPED